MIPNKTRPRGPVRHAGPLSSIRLSKIAGPTPTPHGAPCRLRQRYHTFSFFRHLLGICGRRNRAPQVHAILDVNDKRGRVPLDEYGKPAGIIVSSGIDAVGRKTYDISGPRDQAEAKRLEIAKKNPNMQWRRLHVHKVESRVRHEVDPTSVHLRRLAAKVAFERLAQLHGSSLLIGSEFDAVRDFILEGIEQGVCCGVLSDRRLLHRSLDFPLPYHGIVIIAPPYDRILGAFVMFYSLFYYWVILSRRQRLAARLR